MTHQPSLTSGYISVLLRAIEATENDPIQMRSLVYELARMSLGKQVLEHYKELGAAELHQHLLGLETAIQKVESFLQEDEALLAPPSNVKLIEGPVDSIDQTEDVEDGLSDKKELVVHQNPDSFYYDAHPLPALLASSQISESTPRNDLLRWRVWSDIWPTLQLAIAVILGLIIYVVFVGSDYVTSLRTPRSGDVAGDLPSALKMPNEKTNPSEQRGPNRGADLGFELPATYGVYAVSEGKLFELEPLPIKIPDPRVAISAMISKPSDVTIPNGKISFVAFKRDLVSSAPEKVFIRVVARVAREMIFIGAGPPKITTVDNEWTVRSNSYEFGVAPVNDNPEMIIIRPTSAELSLPAGRYALSLKGQAFDFNINGQVTDAAHCLERTDAVGGSVYSECRVIP